MSCVAVMQEESKILRKRNMQVLSDILDSMTSIMHSTTWQEAQHLLLDNPTFAEDAELLSEWCLPSGLRYRNNPRIVQTCI